MNWITRFFTESLKDKKLSEYQQKINYLNNEVMNIRNQRDRMDAMRRLTMVNFSDELDRVNNLLEKAKAKNAPLEKAIEDISLHFTMAMSTCDDLVAKEEWEKACEIQRDLEDRG